MVEFLVKGNPQYAWIGGLVKPEEAEKIAAFINWTTLVAVTPRPGAEPKEVVTEIKSLGEPINVYKNLNMHPTYTNNWPPEPAIGLDATYSTLFWSLIAFMACWALTIVVMWVFYDYFLKFDTEKEIAEELKITKLTPMQEKVIKFIPLVPLFFVLQTLLGGYMAHLYADPAHSWIVPQSLLPFNVARSFHLNLAILWIAIGWLAGGLFIASLASRGKDFKYPLAVDILWVALVIVGLGGLAGLWLGALGKLPDEWWFWLGNEGREYIEPWHRMQTLALREAGSLVCLANSIFHCSGRALFLRLVTSSRQIMVVICNSRKISHGWNLPCSRHINTNPTRHFRVVVIFRVENTSSCSRRTQHFLKWRFDL
ncbi:MAG: cbb3-type cytochrome c oxidase subunit I [Persephonella sp.]|nr:cbb3-type cytochrome c oxidase subunit I [Persephonella sp.]